ncbi:MAG: hypothetical protein JWM16_6078 [Verrucomicrobiales bacterium]|nr:hypothetical protein [Verrucomicrobiales bacterium]
MKGKGLFLLLATLFCVVETARPASGPPVVLEQPQGQYAVSGSNIYFSVVADGSPPLRYQWLFNGYNIPAGTNAALLLPSITFTQSGVYSVFITSPSGSILSDGALLQVDPQLTFRIMALRTNGVLLADHSALTGADRPGIAVSTNGVFVNGLTATARFDSELLTGGQTLGRRYQAIVSDLKSEKVYSLAAGTNLLTSAGDTVDSLVEIDGTTGALTTNFILLSTNIVVSSSSDVGIFSGYGRIVIHLGYRAYNIMMPSGQVTDLGSAYYLDHNYSSSWAYWGVAEYLGGRIYLLYAQYAPSDVQSIVRARIPDYASTTTAATFRDMNDLASFTMSPSLSRWFFHFEGVSSQLGGFSQTLGSAKALYTTNQQFPVIYSDPTYLSLYPGSNGTFQAQVASSLPLTYQWRFNGTNIPGATNAALLVSNVNTNDAGLYSVAVSNSVGVAISGEGQLSVITSPVVYGNPGSRSVYPGANVTFSGFADGAPPLFYQWYFNGQEIGGATNSTLVLTNIQPLQAGSYGYGVSNQYGTALSDPAILTVVAEPIIISPPIARSVNVGTNASFSVTVDGAPPLRFQWQFNGTNINLATNRTLNLTNVQPAMAGPYTVMISNLFGIASASAALTVITVPSIVTNPASQFAVQGETTSLSVTAQGPGPLYYQWRFNGANIPGETNRIISINNFQSPNTGAYSVLVSNSYGAALSAPADLTLFPVHPEGASFRIATLTANNAKVIDHDSLTSDDRGGIATSLDTVFVTGDNATARFDLDLTNAVRLNQIYDGLASNLRNGKIYLLASNDVPVLYNFSGSLLNRLLELDGRTGAPTGNQIPLSQPIPIYTGGSQNGIFSGFDRIIVHNATNVFQISLPSGVVSNLGPMTIASHASSESWAYWGVAENFGGSLNLVYVRNSTTISRTHVPDGATTTLATFSRLSDMASFTVALYTNRWYFHHEGSSQFGGVSETLGYAAATFDVNPVAYFEWSALDPVQIVGSPFTVTITARTSQNGLATTFNGPVTLLGTNASGGGLVAISPAASGTFTNGVWSGQVRVLQPSSGMFLQATNIYGSTGLSSLLRVLPTDDVSVTIVDSPDPVPVFTTLTYFIVVTNTGPSQASGLFLTNILSTNALLQTVSSSQGACSNDSGVILCNLGTLGGKGSALVTIQVSPLVPSSMTNRVTVSRAEADANLTNNTAVAVTLATLPFVSIADASVLEGNSGTNNMVFNLSLYPASTNTVRVNYITSSSSALSGSDFVFKSGTVTFEPGETNQALVVGVIGDSLYELDEAFNVLVSSPVNCFITRNTAKGLILNDDIIPSLTVSDASVLEGNSGTNNMAFSVSLSSRAGLPVTMSYTTSDGSAKAGLDYLARSGTITFAASTSVLTQTVLVPVRGDVTTEPDETFFLNIVSVSNAIANQSRAIGTILTDDGVGILDHFSVSLSGTQQTVNVPVPVAVVARDFFEKVITNFEGSVKLQAGIGTDPEQKNILGDLLHTDTFEGDYTISYGFTPSVDMIVTGVRHYVGTKVSIWTAGGQLVAAVPVVSTLGTWLETQLPDPVVLLAGENYIVGYYSGGPTGLNPFGLDKPTEFADGVITNAFYGFGDSFPDNSINGSYYFADLIYYTGDGLQPIPSTPPNSGNFVSGVWNGNITFLDTASGVRVVASDNARHNGHSTPIEVVGVPNANVGLFITVDKNPSAVGSNLVLNLTVTNQGPAHASGLVVSNVLPAGFQMVSASLSQGTWSNAAGIIWFALDSLPNKAFATVALTLKPAQTGLFTNFAGVSLAQNDPLPLNNTAMLQLTIFRDSDGDGMWDDWERSVGLNPLDPSDAALDPDGDGFTNLQEFLAGTDPHQATSVLRISQVQLLGGNFHILFQGITGKKYRLERMDLPGLGGWTTVFDFKVGLSRDMDLTDPFTSSTSGRFYRLRLLE